MAECRSCGAQIIWIKTKAGKAMPCDADKVNYTAVEKGTSVIVTPTGDVVRGEVSENGDKSGYISHFATCPFANKHRRK